MRIPRYTRSDLQIMLGILIPFSILLNAILFGEAFYSSAGRFMATLCVTLVYKCISWQFHTLVAVYLRNSLPRDADILRRNGIALVCFFIMTAVDTSLLVWIYDRLHFQGFEWQIGRYSLSLLAGMALNIFATLFHEGTANFERWKLTLTETERLKTEYLKSRVEGLKGQVKPHFLFNSINTLSALIAEDPAKAEVFLDELCKVYRYLLRQEEQFTALGKELDFIHSYYYILKARYGNSLQVDIAVQQQDLQQQIPPFTLHLLIEEILQGVTFSKRSPLHISIISDREEGILLQHTMPDKPAFPSAEVHNLAHLQTRFRLLGLHSMRVRDAAPYRHILIPLQPNTV